MERCCACIWCCVFILPKSGRCWVSVFWCLTPAGQLSVYCHNSDSSPGLKAQGRGHRLLSAPFPLPLASYSRQFQFCLAWQGFQPNNWVSCLKCAQMTALTPVGHRRRVLEVPPQKLFKQHTNWLQVFILCHFFYSLFRSRVLPQFGSVCS